MLHFKIEQPNVSKSLHFTIPPYKIITPIIDIEPLSITENGTYVAPINKAYSPIIVNVPVPSNYGLITYNGHGITVS